MPVMENGLANMNHFEQPSQWKSGGWQLSRWKWVCLFFGGPPKWCILGLLVSLVRPPKKIGDLVFLLVFCLYPPNSKVPLTTCHAQLGARRACGPSSPSGRQSSGATEAESGPLEAEMGAFSTGGETSRKWRGPEVQVGLGELRCVTPLMRGSTAT